MCRMTVNWKWEIVSISLATAFAFGLFSGTANATCNVGKACALNSTCNFWGGYVCANVGGLQDTNACKLDANGWQSTIGACGTKLTWTAPMWCITPSGGTCGTNSLPC